MNLCLTDLKKSRRLFLVCCIIYTANYIGRLNFPAALAAIVAEGVLKKPEAGLIGTVFFICYGLGQLLSGTLADRLSPFPMIFAGLSLSALFNGLMAAPVSYPALCVIWGANGLAQSMLWPGVLRLLSTVLAKPHRQNAVLHITVTVPLGTILAYLISLLVLKTAPWQGVFTAAAVILALAALLFAVTARSVDSDLRAPEEPVEAASKAPENPLPFFRLLAVSGGLALIPSVVIHGMLKDGLMTWVPAMITEAYGITPSFSLFLSMFLPLIQLAGPYLCTFVFRAMVKNEIKTAALFMGLSALPLLPLLRIGTMGAVLSALMLSLVTTFIMAFNYMTITLIPLHFKQYNRLTTLSGLLNSSGYAGSALSGFGFGLLAERFNWGVTVFAWLILVILATLSTLGALKSWNRFRAGLSLKPENP